MLSIKGFAALPLLLSFLIAGVVQAAPVARGKIAGTVKDALGRPLSGAEVTLKTPAQRIAGKTRSNSGGHFVFSNLGPGVYAVFGSKKGYEESSAIVTVKARVGSRCGAHPDIEEGAGDLRGGAAIEPGSKRPVANDGRQRLHYHPKGYHQLA